MTIRSSKQSTRMDPKMIKKTQDTLGKIIKKPPLTEKLLTKPPFRFLHDIFTSVVKTTGFMQGLFTDSEMNSENVKDKDTKMAFLQKAIDMVSTCIGKSLSVKTAKIVAGHEPEKTNELLQGLAEAINKNLDNDEYVKRVLKGGGGGTKEERKDRTKSADRRRSRDKEEGREEKKERDQEKSKDRERRHDKDREERRHDKDREERRHDKDRDERRHDRKERHKERDKDRDQERESKTRERSRGEREDRHRDRDRSRKKDDHTGASKQRKPAKEKSHEESKASTKHISSVSGNSDETERSRRENNKDIESCGDVPDMKMSCALTSATAKPVDRSQGDNGDVSSFAPNIDQACRDQSGEKENESPAHINGEREEKQEPPSRLARPASAKGSRRRREEDEEFQKPVIPTNEIGEDDLPPQVTAARQLARPTSARPAPPRPKQDANESEPAMRLGTGQPTNLIVDDDDDDEDLNFLVEESAPPPPEPDMTLSKPMTEEDEAEHGALVKKMLESKKELEGGSHSQQSGHKKTEIERPVMSDAQRRKQREIVQKEVDKLRTSIQGLTRSANPLGKVMDYVQEDLDSMQQELDKWRAENAEHALELRREMSVTDRAIEPLKQQLKELESALEDQLDQIAATKANIIRNDTKMQKMLRGIAGT